MAGFFYKGIVLRQYKEPALSRDLREFFNTDTTGRTMDWTPVDRPEELPPAQLLAVAAQARIVDERDGAPLAGKLEEAWGTGTAAVVSPTSPMSPASSPPC